MSPSLETVKFERLLDCSMALLGSLGRLFVVVLMLGLQN